MNLDKRISTANPAAVAGSLIQNLLDREILSLHLATGKPCHVLYLGETQWKAFESLAKQICVIPLNSGDEITRAEYCSRKIYRVDAEDYLAGGL